MRGMQYIPACNVSHLLECVLSSLPITVVLSPGLAYLLWLVAGDEMSGSLPIAKQCVVSCRNLMLFQPERQFFRKYVTAASGMSHRFRCCQSGMWRCYI